MEKLQNFLLKHQKQTIVGALIIAAASFCYSLGYMTDLYPLWYYTDNRSSSYVPGSEVYLNGQSFNSALFYITLLLLLVSLSMFIFFSQKRHFYYLSNYITIGTTSALTFITGAIIFVGNIVLKAQFLDVDFEKYKQVTTSRGSDYSDSTFIFDMGFVLAVVMIIWSVAMLLTLIYKNKSNKSERLEREKELANGEA